MKNTLNINQEFLKGATLMELDGLGERRITSVEVIIITEHTARIRLHWESWPLRDTNSFSVESTDTFSYLGACITDEIKAIDVAIKVFEGRSSVQYDPTIERD